jgi:hypothetical protein
VNQQYRQSPKRYSSDITLPIIPVVTPTTDKVDLRSPELSIWRIRRSISDAASLKSGRKTVEASEQSPRGTMFRLIGAVETKYQELRSAMPASLVEASLNALGCTVPGADGVLHQYQRQHRGLFDVQVLRSLVAAVAAVPVLAADRSVAEALKVAQSAIVEMMLDAQS